MTCINSYISGSFYSELQDSNEPPKTPRILRVVGRLAMRHLEFGKGVPIWDGPKGYGRFLSFVNQYVVNWYANCLTLSVLVN